VPLFKNRQWAVTDYGMATVSPAPEYHLEAKRILKTGSAGGVYDWPVHLAEKPWVDIEAFVQAFTQAIEIHKGKYKGDVDPKMLSTSIAEARALARHGRPCSKQAAINQNRIDLIP
jgi:hypothetical protein